MADSTKRDVVVVTGSNKGIGFEICRQLAVKGMTVVVTARDVKRGLEALEKMQESDVSDDIVFRQLDVTDPASIHSLADFVEAKFGKLDVLVNNAGTGAFDVHDPAEYRAEFSRARKEGSEIKWSKVLKAETFELAKKRVETNYYGAKRMCETFVPLLRLSNSPRIVNLTSYGGKLERMPNEWAKTMLSDPESLLEDKIDMVLKEYLKDSEAGEVQMQAKGWPLFCFSYMLSKAALNAYTRVLAKKYPEFCINCIAPGLAKTDITYGTGDLSPAEAAENVVNLVLSPQGSPSGRYFNQMEEECF